MRNRTLADKSRKVNKVQANRVPAGRPIEVDPSNTDALRKMIQEGTDSGLGIDAEIVFADLRKKFESMQKK